MTFSEDGAREKKTGSKGHQGRDKSEEGETDESGAILGLVGEAEHNWNEKQKYAQGNGMPKQQRTI
jgi:hypothetical protein